MSDKKYHPNKGIRVPQKILDQIDTNNFSEWVLIAIKSRLESEHGLTPKYEKTLTLLVTELVAIGRNINQLTRSANSGKPVSLDSRDLVKKLAEIKDEVTILRSKLL